MSVKAAFITFKLPDDKMLFLKRADDEHHGDVGHWDFPGGHIEDNESPKEAAIRETKEEVGWDVLNFDPPIDWENDLDEGILTDMKDGNQAQTFTVKLQSPFIPNLDDEHVGWAWAPCDSPPKPLQKGVKQFLAEDQFQPMLTTAPSSGFPVMAKKKKAEDDDLLNNFHHSALGITRKHNPNRNVLQEKLHKEMASDRLPAGFVKQRFTKLAFDRESMRSYDEDGRLYVKRTPIAKAAVNPYMGAEIPDYERLGLDPKKIYHLLRDPSELQKATASFNNVPLLNKHIRHGADDHDAGTVAGTIGSNAEFVYPYIYNSLSVWPQDAIDDVENESKRELSPSYHYDADMRPGIWKGQHFDGVMRNIRANHVALVKDGRQGPDVVVADSAKAVRQYVKRKEKEMRVSRGVPIRRKAYARILASCAQPKLAEDKRLDAKEIAPLFKGVNAANFASKRAEITKGLSSLLSNRLAKDQASPDDVALRLLDIIHGAEPQPSGGGPDAALTNTGMTGEGSDNREDAQLLGAAGADAPVGVGGPPPGAGGGPPGGGLADKVCQYLESQGVSPEVCEGAKSIVAGGAGGGGVGRSTDASPEEHEETRAMKSAESETAEDDTIVEGQTIGNAAELKKEEKSPAEDEEDDDTAKDEPPPFPGKPKVGGGMEPVGGIRKTASDRMASDSKLLKRVDKLNKFRNKWKKADIITKPAMDAAIEVAVKKAREDERNNRNAIREAERVVRPFVGDLAIAYDSADAVYGAALKALKIEVKGVHPSAYRTILELQPKPGQTQQRKTVVAMDESATKSYAERFPGSTRLKVI